MLSIIPLKDADAAKTYYEKDNYYVKGSQEGIEASHWFGKGAKLLGLSGYVELADFEKLLEGNLPNGIQLGRIEKNERVHRPGYDLTFSAPKSVSILCEIGGDKILEKAHDNAVKTALKYIQTNAINTRAFRNGEIVFERSDNITAALFRHDTSREMDPQTHTHCVLINAVLRQDGKWRSLSSESLFEMKMAAGVVYRAALARLTKELGYTIDITHADGRFEIDSVPENVIKHFSKRREKIENFLAENGLEGAKASEGATLKTRDKKREIERDKLHQKWRDEINDLSFSPEKIISQSLSKRTQIVNQITINNTNKYAKKALRHALAHLSETESVFKEHEIIREALSYGVGDIVLSDIKKAIKLAHKKNELITIDDTRWSTPAAKALEESNINIVQKEQNKVKAITSSKAISSFVHSSDTSYTDGQIDAIKLILTTQDRFVGIQGDAGTGKTTMLKAVKEIAQEASFTILGASPTKEAANQMTEKAGIESITVHKFLQESQYKNPKSYDPTAPLLLIVDESSMLGSRQMNELLKSARSQNIRIVFIGDVKQLSAVTAGKPFYRLQMSAMKCVFMRKVVRQKDDSFIKKSIDLIQNGKISEGFRYISLREESHKEKRLQRIANEYLTYSQHGRKNTLVLVPANDDRLAVNQLIREGLKKEGSLTGKEAHTEILLAKNLSYENTTRAIQYEIDDVIIFNKNYQQLGVSRGDKLFVAHIHKRKNMLVLQRECGKKLLLDLNKAKKFKQNAFSVYKKEKRSLMVGDNIRWLKNFDNPDKKISLVNGNIATVTSVSDNCATVETKDDKKIELLLDGTGYQHWDYAFAHTVYAAQGKDKTRVIAHLESYRPNLTHLSSLYTIVTRAQFDVCLIVDDKEQCISTIEKNTGQKLSVLEELENKPNWKEVVKNTQKHELSNLTQNQTQLSKSNNLINALQYPDRKYWDIDKLQSGLTNQTENLCRQLLGDPNHQLSNTNQLRYGKKGSLSIALQGQYAGTWKNFETDESGNLIQLIQAQGHSFKETLDYAGSFLGLSPDSFDLFAPINTNKQIKVIDSVDTPDQNDLKAIAHAEKIVLQSTQIEDTLAEKYLKQHRGITVNPGPNYRFHPALYEPETKQKLPALLAIAKNQNGNIHAVQAIYLDPETANKADILVKKRTYGRMRFGASVSSGINNTPSVYLTEGPETALSVLSAKPNAKVLAALSLSNFKHIELGKEIKSVTICMDNDGKHSKSNKVIDNVIEGLLIKGLEVHVIKPNTEKTDFNDLLLTTDKKTLSNKLDQAVKVEKQILDPFSDLGKNSLKTLNKDHSRKNSVFEIEI